MPACRARQTTGITQETDKISRLTESPVTGTSLRCTFLESVNKKDSYFYKFKFFKFGALSSTFSARARALTHTHTKDNKFSIHFLEKLYEAIASIFESNH